MSKLKPVVKKVVYKKTAELFRIIANSKRLEILDAIKDKELSVNELSKMLGTLKSNTSQHLAILRYSGLVVTRRDGKNIFYKISDAKVINILNLLGN